MTSTAARVGVRPGLSLVALLSAHGLSLAGNAITLVAVPLYVLHDTGSVLATGVAGIASTAPLIIGGALGGVLVDRVGFRRAAVVADVASGVTVLAIPVLAATIGLPFWALLALVFVGGLLDTPGSTAKTAIIPDLVAASGVRMNRVAGAQSAISRSATMVGASVAALAISALGPLGVLLLDAATFAVSAVLVWLLVPRDGAAVREGEGAPSGYWMELAAGMRFLSGSPVLRNLVLLVVVTNTIDAAGMLVIKPVYASSISADGTLFGVMVALFAAGALSGAALYGLVGHRLPDRPTLVVCFLLAGAPPYIAMALGFTATPLLVTVALAGLAAGSINPLISTLVFELTPRALRARVLGALTTGVSLGMPLGSLVGGVAIAQWGLAATAAVAAAVYATASLAPLAGRGWRALDGRRAGVALRGAGT
jgi:MFS family permease